MKVTGKKIANWKEHQELFIELLELKEPARLLTIHNEKPDTGKSTLLVRLKYICAKEKAVPVSLVPLEDQSLKGSFEMVSHLRDDLVHFQLKFPRFDEAKLHWAKYDIEYFSPAPGASRGAVNAGGATISGGVVAGTVQQVANQTVATQIIAEPKLRTGWPNSTQEQKATEGCVKAFFEDLKEICQQKTVVLLFDSWDSDRGSETLRNWIEYDLLPTHCFDVAQRPARLVIVLAGREEFNLGAYPLELARSKPFKTWDEQDIKEFVALHGYEGTLEQEDWQWLFAKFKKEKITAGGALTFLSTRQ